MILLRLIGFGVRMAIRLSLLLLLNPLVLGITAIVAFVAWQSAGR